MINLKHKSQIMFKPINMAHRLELNRKAVRKRRGLCNLGVVFINEIRNFINTSWAYKQNPTNPPFLQNEKFIIYTVVIYTMGHCPSSRSSPLMERWLSMAYDCEQWTTMAILSVHNYKKLSSPMIALASHGNAWPIVWTDNIMIVSNSP